MTGQIKGYLRGLLTIALAVGMLLSANSGSVTHHFTELAKIIAEHRVEIADHDHNIAFLPSRDPSGSIMQTSTSWAMVNSAMPNRRNYGLDRPPRV